MLKMILLKSSDNFSVGASTAHWTLEMWGEFCLLACVICYRRGKRPEELGARREKQHFENKMSESFVEWRDLDVLIKTKV